MNGYFARRLTFVLVTIAFLYPAAIRVTASTGCVWKVTAPDGKTLYLGGSIHALRSTDYPLPAAYNQAFDAATNIAFEVDAKALVDSSKSLVQSGEYPRGDNLKAHVDPRTYAYLQRVFKLLKMPETKFSRYRPWFIVLILQSPEGATASHDLGVDEFLMKRAVARKKPVVGLESTREHAAVYSGLSDRQSEALLLLSFIPNEQGSGGGERLMAAWRRGDADGLAQLFHQSYAEFPGFGNRLLDERNRQWIPKIQSYLQSGKRYFVVAGAAHFGGPNGVLALLRSRGYRIEQL